MKLVFSVVLLRDIIYYTEIHRGIREGHRDLDRQSILFLSYFHFISILFPSHFHPIEPMNLNLVHDFIESINRADIESMSNLMTTDTLFIDSQGNEMMGKELLKEAWKGYFGLFPDYQIEITDTLQKDNLILMTGSASGTCQPTPQSADNSNHWRIPAAWKAVVLEDKIKLWQVFADNSVVLEILNRNR